ncbi:phage integrase N-terminal SAM-like domain-containing protein, partial [Chitinispirillales bacterium ANBcel5]|uniref:phage integrase N-terminal SAM-like domain-containing protein n=1 Tax=Cellulosispirillum alkaliphilum TaxID=3039283 RepID=UPI002A513982|nr:phage integrase N-terminal SAM-like domain-containing protein [Chitinispirillales bacterium ANBcel5]
MTIKGKHPISITSVDDTYIICFNYNRDIVDAVRSLPGRRYDAAGRVWHIPKSPMVKSKIISTLSPLGAVTFTNDHDKNSSDLFQDDLLERCVQQLKRKRYSNNTIRNYSRHIANFLSFARQNEQTDETVIIHYLNYLVTDKFVTGSYQSMSVNAIRFLMVDVLGKRMPECALRPKREKYLPVVLSETEVLSILHSVTNLKHKLALTL